MLVSSRKCVLHNLHRISLERNIFFQRAFGYVSIEAENKVFQEELSKRLSTLRKRMLKSNNAKELSKIVPKLQYLSNLHAVVSGNVPCQQIIQTRVHLFKQMKQFLLQINKLTRSVNHSFAVRLTDLVCSTLEGSCEMVLYIAIIPGPTLGLPKLLVVYQDTIDTSLQMVPLVQVVPPFAQGWAKLIEVNFLRQQLGEPLWNDVKMWMAQDHLEIKTSDEWQKSFSDTLSHIYQSKRLMSIVIEQIHRLCLAEDLKVAQEKRHNVKYCALVCLNFAKMYFDNFSASTHMLNEMKELTVLLESQMLKNNEELVKRKFIEISELMQLSFELSHCPETDMFDVDVTLNQWRQKTCFDQNIRPSHLVGKHKDYLSSSQCSNKKQRAVLSGSIQKSIDSYLDKDLAAEQLHQLKLLQAKFGDPVDKILPSNILLVSRFGSHLYNLATDDSDVDYMIIFRRPQSFSFKFQCEDRLHCKDLASKMEFNVIEARNLCENLYRSKPMMCEMILEFSHADFVHPAMKLLLDNSNVLVCERLFQAFKGYAKIFLHRLRSGMQKDRALKNLYVVYHKILILEDLAKGVKPRIHIVGEDRDFIISVRNGKILKQKSLSTLYNEAKERLEQVQRNRIVINNEYPDYRSLKAWLKLIRETSR